MRTPAGKSSDRALDDAEAHDLWVGKQAVEIRGVACVRGGEGAAVEGRGRRVEQRELAADVEVGEIYEQVGALGRCEHKAVRGDAGGGAKESVIGADLGDPTELGVAIPHQDEPGCARWSR
jgi:hypothetical protein